MYNDAFAILLEPDVWRDLSLNHYLLWANEIWHILVLRASRRYASLEFLVTVCLTVCFGVGDNLACAKNIFSHDDQLSISIQSITSFKGTPLRRK